METSTSSHARVPVSHFAIALAVVAIWGTNFVVIRKGLDSFPPLLFATLRYCLALFPAVFFLRKPAVPWGDLAAYGVLIGAGQFGLLYIAMNGRISPGLASLVIQTQVFFTIGLAMWMHAERLRIYHLVALLLAASAIAVIAIHTDGQTTVAGLGLVLLGALSWAGGNLVSRRAGRINMVAYVVWASMFSVPPLLMLSLWLEGPAAIVRGLESAGWTAWAAVLWQSAANTMFGYAAWAWLLARHPAASITPMALLVPIFGMGASAVLLAEPLPAWKLIAAGLIIGGLAINMLWPAWRHRSRLN